jgi:hypothetical protein
VDGAPDLRIVRGRFVPGPDGTARSYGLYHESGTRVIALDVGGGRLVLGWDRAPLIVHTDVPRAERPIDVTVDEQGVTARFAVPDVPDGAEYLFPIEDGPLHLREVSPLLGVAAAEGHLRGVRVVVGHFLGGGLAEVLRVPQELRGPGAGLFRLEGPLTDADLIRRFGSGTTLTERATGIRYHFGPDSRLVFRDLPLEEDRYLRVAAGGRETAPQVVRTDGLQVRPHHQPEFGWEGHGLTVRLALSYAPEGFRAEFRFDAEGVLVRQELLPAFPRSPRVIMERRTGQPGPWTYQLVGAPYVADRSRIELPTRQFQAADLARDLGSDRVFMMNDHETGLLAFYEFSGRRLAVERLVDGDPGLRLVRYEEGSAARPSHLRAGIYDEAGNRVRTVDVGAHRLLLRRIVDPLLVDTDSGRFEMPVRLEESPAAGMRLWYPVPGAPDGVRAQYQLDADERLIRSAVPLTGGGAGEEHLRDLRVVSEFHYPGPGQAPEPHTQLEGGNSTQFELGTPERDGGITLIERAPGQGFPGPAAGVRRHYDAEYRLVLRNIPVEVGGFLRVDVRGGQDALQLNGDDGPLAGWRAERLEGDRVALLPTAWDHLPEGERPPTRMVVHAGNGRLLGETLHVQDGDPPGSYWEINYVVPRDAVLRDSSGRELERTDRVAVSLDFTDRQLWNASGNRLILHRSQWDIVAGASTSAGPAPAP